MYAIFKVLFIYAILLLIPESSQAEFVILEEDKTKSCFFRLFEAKEIPHQCIVKTDNSNPLEVWKNRLSFNFGKISEPDFIYLKNTYSGWSESHTSVDYDRDKSYQLIDFLPPLIQALNGHRFIPEATTINHKNEYFGENSSFPQTNLKKYLYMNCWGLVYEILRAARNSQTESSIFMAQSSMMLERIRNNSEMILSFSADSELPIASALDKPGDILLIMHQSRNGYEYLDHIAIVIDDGIYFEKAGTGKDVPIRIIDRETLSQIWSLGIFRYELRRLHKNAVLPHPKEVFSLNSSAIKKQFSSVATIPLAISQNTSITWDIESKDLSSISWFHIINISPLSLDETGKARLTEKLY